MKTPLVILFIIGYLSGYTQGVGDRQRVSVISKSNRIEFSPTISADGRTMIFETQNGKKWELYQSHLDDAGKWSEPVPLTTINDKCQFIAGPSLSYDGNTLFYTAFIEEVTQTEDIFFSVRLSDNQWSEPKSIGAPVNTDEEYEGFPSISSDGNTLYFIRHNKENPFERKSKEPCFIIYASHKREDGSWDAPKALPNIINGGCVRDPRIMADNHTLIFSSIFAEGKGKYDLFQTRLQHDSTWDEPVALDFINTAENDQSPCISAAGNTMFYYSDNDIYQVAIPQEYRQLINATILGKVYAGKSRKPVNARVIVIDKSTGERFVTESNANDGRYSVVLAAGQVYEIVFFNPSYHPDTVAMDLSGTKTYMERKVDAILDDSFDVNLTVTDKDLNTPVKALVRLAENNGAVLFSDSVKGSAPQRFELKTEGVYMLGIFAPGYTPVEKTIRFQGELARREVTLVELIEHEKIKMMAEVTDVNSGNKKRLKVTYNNENNGEVIVADAGDVVNLRKGDRYQVVSNSDKGHTYSIKTVIAGEGATNANGEYVVELPVTALVEGAKLALNHIYFETNSWTLSDVSALELANITELLRQNPGLKIEISAHTDDVGADEYNTNLSQRRAASVIEYLNKKGIPKAQLMAKGYGKSMPMVPNDSDENRAKNRRVELVVLSVN